MKTTHVIHLDQCTEFAQTLMKRPPWLLHATTVLMLTLMVSMIIWMQATPCDLVVVARGRIRPLGETTEVVAAAEANLLGRVVQVDVQEGQRVTKGDVIARLDSTSIENSIERMNAKLSAAAGELERLIELDSLIHSEREASIAKLRSELEHAQRNYATACEERETQVRIATSELQLAMQEHLRAERLAESKAISESERSKAEVATRSAQDRLELAKSPVASDRIDQLRHEIELSQRSYRVKLSELDAQRVVKRGEVDSFATELNGLKRKLENAVIRAPIDGVIVSECVDSGFVLQPGQKLAEIAPLDGLRFEAVVPSVDVGELTVGLPVKIKMDAFDHQQFGVLSGKVAYIAPDSTFAKNSEGEQVGYLIRIDLDEYRLNRAGQSADVKLGMGGIGEIVTGHERLLGVLFKTLRRSISLSPRA